MTRATKPTRRLSAGKGKSLFGGVSSSTVRLRPLVKQAKGNIKVAVRIRPPTEAESVFNSVVKAVSESQLVFDPKEEEDGFFFHGVKQTGFRDLNKKANRNAVFAFDNVFSESATNQEVFELTTKSVIRSVLDGYNCSVFAYGATGAGKTYTMLGTESIPGIVYLTVTDLWEQMEGLKETRSYEVAVSYLEIYNELVKDLLSSGEPLNLREDPSAGVIVQGLTFHKPRSSDELLEILRNGNEKRTQHPTDANKESSRSHAVFQVWLKQRDPNTHTVISVAKLSLIDLAGSERGSATGHTGDRFKEGTNINKSLLALGNCICALAEGRAHIPFRDSKLTRILKDSLGGNCHTVMIAAVSPSHVQYEDTYNTLKYADRAKKIKATFVKKVMSPFDLKIAQLEGEVEVLRTKIGELTEQLKKYQSGEASVAPVQGESKWTKEDIETCKKSLKQLSQARKEVRVEILKIQSVEKEVTYRMQTRQESLKRCMKISIGGQVDAVAKKADRLESLLQKKLAAYHLKTAETMKRLTSIDNSIAKYEKKLDAKFGEEWPEEITVYLRSLKLECRVAELVEKNNHLEKLMGIREQAANEDQDQIFGCLEMIQTYYLLMRSGGLISQYQEVQFEKFVASLERDVGIIWETDVNGIDKDMTRLSVGKTEQPTFSPQVPQPTSQSLAVPPTIPELDDTTMSGVSPVSAKFARVNDSFAIRRDVKPTDDSIRVGVENGVSAVVDRSVGETEILVPSVAIKQEPDEHVLKDTTNTTSAESSLIPDNESTLDRTVSLEDQEPNGNLDSTIVFQRNSNLDGTVLLPTKQRSTFDTVLPIIPPVIDGPDFAASEVPCRKSNPVPIRRPVAPVRTLPKQDDSQKENLFKMPPPIRQGKPKEGEQNRGLKRVPSTVSRSMTNLAALRPVIDSKSPGSNPVNLRVTNENSLTPNSLLAQRGRSASTSKLNKA